MCKMKDFEYSDFITELSVAMQKRCNEHGFIMSFDTFESNRFLQILISASKQFFEEMNVKGWVIIDIRFNNKAIFIGKDYLFSELRLGKSDSNITMPDYHMADIDDFVKEYCHSAREDNIAFRDLDVAKAFIEITIESLYEVANSHANDIGDGIYYAGFDNNDIAFMVFDNNDTINITPARLPGWPEWSCPLKLEDNVEEVIE